jgi:hypothetical protein
MPIRRLPLPAVALAVLAAGALAPGAAPLAALTGVEVFRGSHCHPSHFNGETEEWAYEGPNLVNRGTSAWDVLIASCPTHATPFQPVSTSRIFEVRVYVDGATASNAWCSLTDWQGVERSMTPSPANPRWFVWNPPSLSNVGWHSRDFTVECLLLPDWELERVEVVWSW